MSTPVAKPMRQQLDELDALLQRMLSLPINQLEAESPPAAPPPPAAIPDPPVMPAVPPIVSAAPPMVREVPPSMAAAPPVMTYTPPPPPPAPAAPPPIMARRAEPPRGEHAWNIPLPANAGGAPFAGFPVGIEALTATATSTITPRRGSPPFAPPSIPPAPPSPAAPPPAPPAASSPTYPYAPPPPTTAPAAGRFNVTMIPAPDQQNQAFPSGGSEQSAPELAASPKRSNPVSPPPPVPLRPALPLPAPITEGPLPFYLWPAGAIDSIIGGTLAAFGPPGRWLGQGGGKILIGWFGLFMIVTATAWGVMDYLGWSW